MKKQFPQEEGIYLIEYYNRRQTLILISNRDVYNFLSNEFVCFLKDLHIEFCSQKLEIGYLLNV